MPLPTRTLAAIQTAGAAVHAADTALKEAVQSYADHVKLAMHENPFDIGNDELFNDWKTVARLSRAVGQVEAEFRKIYSAASDLSAGAVPTVLTVPTLTAPDTNTGSDLAMVREIDATDVVAKKRPEKIKTKPKTKATAKPTSSSKQALRGNAVKVLARLSEMLNPTEFVKVNRSALAKECNMPQGSIGASIAKLIDTGHLMEGSAGEFTLATPAGQ